MPVPASPSLADCLKQRRDNFLLLRLLAASLVIYGHSYAIAGTGAHDFIALSAWGPGVYTGSIAVDIFFVVSGFLIAGSYINRSDLRFFFRSRFLRIVPAYFVCVAATALIIGPLVTTLATSEYFSHIDTWHYLLKNMTFTRLEWYLPGVFESNPHPRVVNGSLWTLPAEVRMYMLVALAGFLGMLHKRWLFNSVLAACALLSLWFPEQALGLFRVDSYFRLAWLFALGSFFYVNRDHIPVNGYLAAMMAALAYWLHGTPHFMSAFGLALGYGSLWFAYAPRLEASNRIGDYSYGIYLWGFPIQQLVAMSIDAPSPMQIFAWSMALTTVVAIASWHLVEKPALRLKNTPMRHWPSALLTRKRHDSASSATA